jgi:hypothetical protein
MILTVHDRLSGKKYRLEVFEENTAKSVINVLIKKGLIGSSPGQDYEWALVDSRFYQIFPDERIIPRASSNEEGEVYLIARAKHGGKQTRNGKV